MVNPQIQPLKKVSVTLSEAGQTGLKAPVRLDFIFGLGINGLSPFESKLEGKTQGQEVEYLCRGNELHRLFEHLMPAGLCGFASPAPLCLKVTIDAVADAGQREIVKALANASACGDHCCGDHCGH